MLEEQIYRFANLNVAQNQNHWSGLTMNKAPHKAFTLLAVIDLIAIGFYSENVIPPSPELVENFNDYWELVMPSNKRSNMAYPFPRLARDEIWALVPAPGQNLPVKIDSISSMSKLRQVCSGAVFPDDLYKHLCNSEDREVLRVVLLENYFSPEIRSLVAEQGIINQESFGYGQRILSSMQTESIHEPENEYVKEKIRKQGFRKAIVSLYDHRCALCGIRLLTPDGHTIVEAAHIIPWRQNQDDNPTNGMALCRLCHWSFDEGMMGVKPDYTVLVSKRIQIDNNFPGHMSTLIGRQIIKPENPQFFPAPKNLEWHLKNTFA